MTSALSKASVVLFTYDSLPLFVIYNGDGISYLKTNVHVYICKKGIMDIIRLRSELLLRSVVP